MVKKIFTFSSNTTLESVTNIPIATFQPVAGALLTVLLKERLWMLRWLWSLATVRLTYYPEKIFYAFFENSDVNLHFC